MEHLNPESPRSDSMGTGGQAFGALLPTAKPESDATSAYRFNPARQAIFLKGLSIHGTVSAAARQAGITRQAAYDLRGRDAGFATAWASAKLLAKEVSEEEFTTLSLHGWKEEVWHRGELVGYRQRRDVRLLLAHMARLDRDTQRVGSTTDFRARRYMHIGAARFEEVLDAIGSGHDAMAVIKRGDKRYRDDDEALNEEWQKRCGEICAVQAESDAGGDSQAGGEREGDIFSPGQCQKLSTCTEIGESLWDAARVETVRTPPRRSTGRSAGHWRR